jgi:alkylated DNA repair dioxygenase AlkB
VDHGPDIFVKPDFEPEHRRLFRTLWETVAWGERMQARKTASFGLPYDYSHMSYPEAAMHPALVPLCGRIDATLGFMPNNCLLNLYIDGGSSLGFHSDATDRLALGTGVAIVSLGATRTLSYRRRSDRMLVHAYRLESGSLLFMSNAIQAGWSHAILPEPEAGPRISLTFRRIRRS